MATLKKINKVDKPKYWYKYTYTECPVCGRGSTEKVRMYTEKPKDSHERHKYEQYYDWCDV